MNRSILKFITTSVACLILFSASTDTAYADTAKVLRKKESSTITNSVSSERVVYRLGLTAGKKRRIESDIKHSNSVNKSVTSDKSVASIDKSDSKSNTKTAVSKVSKKSVSSRSSSVDREVDVYSIDLKYAGKMGEMIVPSLDLNCDMYYGSEQSIVDADNSIAVTEYVGYIGEERRNAVLFDHNYQTGDLLKGLSKGDTIEFKTEYGDFVYKFSKKYTADVVYGRYSISGDMSLRFNKYWGYVYNDFVLRGSDFHVMKESTRKKDSNKSSVYFITCCTDEEGTRAERIVLKFDKVSGPVVKEPSLV